MTVRISIHERKRFHTDASTDIAFELLADVPRSASHFPNVDHIEPMGDNCFRWEMKPIGFKNFNIQTVYGCRYISDRKHLSVNWSPIESVGNAQVTGSWHLESEGKGCVAEFETRGELTLPFPKIASRLIAPFAEREFSGYIDEYVENIKAALDRLAIENVA